MKIQRCKGTRDWLPEEMAKFRLIEGAFRDYCLKAGYQEIRTPTLEYLHLFTAAGTLTPSRLNRVYSFLDWDGWSGERVVLRPDGTIPAARLFIENMTEREIARLFYITNVFVFEDTGKKDRELWQCGAELIGVGTAAADVELITLALTVLKNLGIKGVELKLSHAGLIKALLNRLGLSPDEQAAEFDKLMDGERGVLARMKSDKPELGEALSLLLELKGEASGFLKNLRAVLNHSLPELEPHIDNFIAICDLLKATGNEYQIDLASERGFEYYTGIIFQLFHDDNKLGGGGRYDALIPSMSGGNIPASGFALYCDQLMKLVSESKIKRAGRIVVGANSEEGMKEVFAVVSRLREAGYTAEINLAGKPPDSAEWALEVRNGTPHFRLTGPDKKRSNAATLDEILAHLSR